MTDGFKQACLVKPVHPIKSLPLERLDRLPGAFLSNQLRLIKPVDGLGKHVVVAVSGAAHRGLDASLREPFAVAVESAQYCSKTFQDALTRRWVIRVQ